MFTLTPHPPKLIALAISGDYTHHNVTHH